MAEEKKEHSCCHGEKTEHQNEKQPEGEHCCGKGHEHHDHEHQCQNHTEHKH